jgi:cytochrome c oxidase subunit 3
VNIWVAYGALLSGVLLWLFLVRKLSARSWEAEPAGASATVDTEDRHPAKVGLWVFLGVVTSLFALFISAYYMRMGHGHGAVHDWHPVSEPKVLWLNTALLLLSSVAMQWARSNAQRGAKARTRDGLLLGGLLTFAFVIGQLYAWQQVVPPTTDGWFLRDPAIAFFYVLTAVHGLHLLGGIYVCGRTLLRLQAQDVEAIDVRVSVELCTTYWHFLLIVWLVLFGLLLAT